MELEREEDRKMAVVPEGIFSFLLGMKNIVIEKSIDKKKE